ncbi:sodium-independent anion transporter [Rhodospirillum rubrum]|uniref:SulP family inorganic anion transporter n=2 Tax=Rhodospirillum rubrum TaxID=1085 RepID=UPI001904279F|nr:sodium-independent anion transporter [Rhodospirillum rubrum]
MTRPPEDDSFLALFTPKLVTMLRDGYGLGDLRADALAGLTVAIVALPLSMAIAIASGATPEQGLFTAIVGGFLISALGGSRFQVGGPAGAFIVLVAATVAEHGFAGMILATFLAGMILVAMGLLRLGTYVKFIPYPVTVGFTAGIGVVIFTTQIKDLLGLSLSGPEPGEIFPKLMALGSALPSITPAALLISIPTVAFIVLQKRFRPGWPGMLLAVALGSLTAWLFDMPIETVGSRFGEIPRTLPLPSLPVFSFDLLIAVLPNAAAFALLGAIESLLSAVVADGMTGRRHRSNCELVAQGVANMASALFGGICATGTIARTATNVRAGAHGPIAGMLHSLFLLGFLAVAAPLVGYIPLASLAAVLAIVAWNMIERHAFAVLLRTSRGDTVVLMATFLLTIFRDLTEGIIAGFLIGTLLFLNRMAKATVVEADQPLITEDRADGAFGRSTYDAALASDPRVVVYRISGAFFFGAASTVGSVLDRIADQRKAFVLDFAAVPFLDSTAANAIEGAVRKAQRHKVKVFFTGASPKVRRTLLAHDLRPPRVIYKRTIDDAVTAVKAEPS